MFAFSCWYAVNWRLGGWWVLHNCCQDGLPWLHCMLSCYIVWCGDLLCLFKPFVCVCDLLSMVSLVISGCHWYRHMVMTSLVLLVSLSAPARPFTVQQVLGKHVKDCFHNCVRFWVLTQGARKCVCPMATCHVINLGMCQVVT